MQARFPPKKLQLLEGGTVRFDEGPAHGQWEYHFVAKEFIIEFHYNADPAKLKRKRFIWAPSTTSYELDLRTADASWWAVIAPTMQPKPVD